MKELESKGFFTNEDGTNALKSELDPKRKYGRDVMLPKLPRSAYTFFVADNVRTLMEKEKLKSTEAITKVAKMWKSLSEKKKKPYEK